MTSPRLPNYLRAHRKRLGLSQDDMAGLLGSERGAKVCRYEKFLRTPTLETALAYEVIFRKPVRELFAGLYQTIERRVATRAAKIRYLAPGRETDRINIRKTRILDELVPPSFKKSPKKQ